MRAFIPILPLMLAAGLACAQKPGCPDRSAPMPKGPPGPPPSFTPEVVFPPTFDGRVQVSPPPPREPRREAVVDVEEGHVSALAWQADRARPEPPPHSAADRYVDVPRTALASWRFIGYRHTADRETHRLTRYFGNEGGIVSLEEWHYAEAGGATFPTREPDLRVGGMDARRATLRAPSGCVKSMLSWADARTDYRLEAVGPWSADRQRELLESIANSVAQAEKGR